MAGTMYDELNEVDSAEPDYAIPLSVSPQRTLVEKATRRQKVYLMDDGSPVVIERGDGSITFIVTLVWPSISVSDARIIFDYWTDSNKADGMNNTFAWNHPDDSHQYSVRFMTNIAKEIRENVGGIQTVQILVEKWIS